MAIILNDERSNATSSAVIHDGGPLQVHVTGADDGSPTSSLNGMTVTMQVAQDGLRPYVPLTNGVFSTADIVVLDMAAGSEYRFVVTGQTANFGVSVSVLAL